MRQKDDSVKGPGTLYKTDHLKYPMKILKSTMRNVMIIDVKKKKSNQKPASSILSLLPSKEEIPY